MTDLEKALAKIEEGAGELRRFDNLAAHDIEELVAKARKDAATESINDELDSARSEAA